MSFSIKLQYNSSPSNKIGKNLTDIITVSGTLRSGSSILDPVVVVDTALSSDVISNINYAYIEEFSRYYYITEIANANNRLWVIAMHVDVLETYKDEIKSQTAVVSRQEHEYNLMLDDGWFMAYQNPFVQIKGFSNTSPFENQQFILVIAGS